MAVAAVGTATRGHLGNWYLSGGPVPPERARQRARSTQTLLQDAKRSGVPAIAGKRFERARCAGTEFQKSASVWKPGTNFASARRRSPVFPELTACPTERGVADQMPDFPILGRRDKSTAVGRGACGWLNWNFLSAPTSALLAHSSERPMVSLVAAPSPTSIPCQRDGE